MVRDFVPEDDELESTNYEVYYDIPAETDKDLAVRWYISIERDPERIARWLRP